MRTKSIRTLASEEGFSADDERALLAAAGPEDAFDRLTELAAALTGAPWSFVTLVGDTRYYFKSAVGLGEGASRYGLVEQSFCRYVVGSGRPLVVEDAVGDPRTWDNPAIVLLGVAAWAGYPLEGTSGSVLGTFCVADRVPHPWSDQDLQVLATLAKAASSEVELVILRATLEEMRGPLAH